MTYPEQHVPTQPQEERTPPKPKSRAVPWLIGAIAVLVLGMAGLGFALLSNKGEPPAAASNPAAAFDAAQSTCGVVAGYRIEDSGATLIMTVGGQLMNTTTMDCVFNSLGVPAAVRSHVTSTRALDGQQTDSWPGYAARWTYHPDNGLQMTIQAK